MSIDTLDRRDYDGTGASDAHVEALLDKIDEVVGQVNDGVCMRRFEMSSRAEGSHDVGELHATKDCLLLDLFVVVSTIEESGTTTVDVGVDTTTDGVGDAVPVGVAGKIRPQATVTVGGSETYYSANTRGSLMSDYIAGSNTDGDFGLYREKPTWVTAGDQLNYTVPSGGWTEFAGYLLAVYVEQPPAAS